MSTAVAVLIAGACLAAGLFVGIRLASRSRGLRGHPGRRVAPRRLRQAGTPTRRRILVPFTGQEISRRAFDAAVGLARAEQATIVPAFLARVPRRVPLDTPLLAQSDGAMELLEALEQRATRSGVTVDARVSRGRSYRDALSQLLAVERFDRIVVCAPERPRRGLSYDDLRWLLTAVPAEIMILQPAPDDRTAPALRVAAWIGRAATQGRLGSAAAVAGDRNPH